MNDQHVKRIAELLRKRNAVDAEIAAIMHRPMASGHLGEWIASEVFDIELEPAATAPAIDGRYRSGRLEGSTVNVKWYLKREGLLDMSESDQRWITTSSWLGRRLAPHPHAAGPGRAALRRCSCSMRGICAPSRSREASSVVSHRAC